MLYIKKGTIAISVQLITYGYMKLTIFANRLREISSVFEMSFPDDTCVIG